LTRLCTVDSGAGVPIVLAIDRECSDASLDKPLSWSVSRRVCSPGATYR
jgi:hypothetical protein